MFVDAVKGGMLLYDQRAKVLSIWKQLQRWITTRNQTILVVGPGGAGKSTLGKILSNGPGVYKPPSLYKESLTTETLNLRGDVAATLVVAPGQALRRRRSWPALLRDLTNGQPCGMINVVSYGYHSIEGELSHKQLPAFKHRMTAKKFMEAYTAEKQKLELDVLREVQPHLISAPGKIWMLTIVTKQDLWWTDRLAVRRHYESGSYRELINQIEQQRGPERFAHEYLSASLVMQNFTSGQNELLAKTVSGYDEVLQAANLQLVFDAIGRLAGI